VLAREHDLVLLDIADVIEFRIKREMLIERTHESTIQIPVNGSAVPFQQYVYQSRIKDHPQEFLALVHGKPTTAPTLCRVHQGHLLLDQFGIRGARGRVNVDEALRLIVREGSGVLLYLPPRETMMEELETKEEHTRSPAPETDSQQVLRRFGLGAQILLHLGLKRIRLITRSPSRIVGLEGFNLEIVEYVAP
jgi:3,4-dihydroxy 2-butanone 4-phosphate synthase/GTP cyclohydrolase II